MNLPYILSILFLIFGFGFVIFWHELGHFLAAKRSGIRVEQFAVGMGHAIFSWRKGIGFRAGNTQKEYERLAREQILKKQEPLAGEDVTPAQIAQAAAEIGLGDTEYRLNWIPIGGYVKMLGQDDMDATASSDDPRAFNRKSIGARMFVVSAGVIMNLILAAIGFMILFLVGFQVSPSIVGHVVPGSPAQEAGFLVGDNILSIDGNYVEPNFTKVVLNSALLRDGDEVLVKIKRNGQPMDLKLTPRRPGPKQLVSLGLGQPIELTSPQGVKRTDEEKLLYSPDTLLLNPGDQIVQIAGQDVKDPRTDYAILDRAVQHSFGNPVAISIKGTDGKVRTGEVHPRFAERFGSEQMSFAGLVPRAAVSNVLAESPAKGKLLPGDVVLSIAYAKSNDKFSNVSPKQLRDLLGTAGSSGQNVDMTVLRDGKEVPVEGLTPNLKLDKIANSKGLGIGLGLDTDHVVVAQVIEDSPAAAAGITKGAEILAVGGEPVKTWNDVFRHLYNAKAGEAVEVTYKTANVDQKVAKVVLSEAQLAEIKTTGYANDLALSPLITPQKTTNPLEAAKWGVLETRDFILQFYVTLRRFADGTVSPSNAMGPVGIFSAGTTIASRGNDWMLWFLCMISANLAVVNFLPIPVVDGGLFMFLILEKIKGKPLSPKAQQAAQIAGLALLGSIFLFVTYNDITRLL